jgi:hypothetical protein
MSAVTVFDFVSSVSPFEFLLKDIFPGILLLLSFYKGESQEKELASGLIALNVQSCRSVPKWRGVCSNAISIATQIGPIDEIRR